MDFTQRKDQIFSRATVESLSAQVLRRCKFLLAFGGLLYNLPELRILAHAH
jgi:hypothetical protein